MRPFAVDLCCGLGGWAEGLLAEDWDVIGFDIERHDYGTGGYPAQLVLQDVLTLHGSQFRNADLIVASPPCQEYSYMAMPWSRAKAIAAEYRSGARDTKKLTALFDACFRIQREAIAAAGHHIPLVVENVRGAQPWVGRSRWNFGSFHLWGDVPALMPMVKAAPKVGGLDWNGYKNGDPDYKGQAFNTHAERAIKVPGFRFDGSGRSFQSAQVDGLKVPGNKLSENGFTIPIARQIDKTLKPDSFKLGKDDRRQHLSFSRKAASAAIAKIPEPLARHIARTFYPQEVAA